MTQTQKRFELELKLDELHKDIVHHAPKPSVFACSNGCGKTFSTPRGASCHSVRCSKPQCAFEDIKTNGARKNRLLNELGRRCQVCLNKRWRDLPIPIEIDHIDGDPENNDRDNLRLICPNCHAQTPTYRGRNMGKVKNSKRAQTLKKYYGKYR